MVLNVVMSNLLMIFWMNYKISKIRELEDNPELGKPLRV